MAGCLPEYLPWVLTAIEAICNDEFNIHGVLATTMPVGPVIICSGPGTRAIGMNGAGNALGQGNRANLTIGRAVQLVVRNVGGGRPQGVDRAAHGNPGKLSFCFCEHPDSPFTHARRVAAARRRALTPSPSSPARDRAASSTRSRVTPESLARSLAVVPADRAPPEADASGSTPCSCSAPSTAGSSTRPAGIATGIVAERDRRRSPPGQRARRRRRRHGRGPAGAASPTARWPKFRDDGILLALRGWRRRAVLGHHRWLGQRRHGQHTGHQRGTTMTDPLHPRSDRRARGRRAPAPRPAGVDRRAARRAARHPQAARQHLPRSARAPADRRRRHGAALRQADVHQAGARRPAPRDRHPVRPRDRGARRLRQLHVVQCARHQ